MDSAVTVELREAARTFHDAAESIPERTVDEANREAVGALVEAIVRLDEMRLDDVDLEARADALRTLDEARTMLEARLSRELRGFATVDHLRAIGVSSLSGWLVAATGTSRLDAGRRTTLANTLAAMPLLEEAMLAGEVPIDAARVLARAVNPRTEARFDVFTQAAFVDAARRMPLDRLADEVQGWLDRNDPDGPDPDDPATDTLHANRVGDRVALKGDLSAVTGIGVLAALDEEMAKIRAAEPRDADGTLRFRLASNRRAEALANLCARGAAAPDSTTRREPAFLVVDDSTDGVDRFRVPGWGILPLRLADTFAVTAARHRLAFARPGADPGARLLDDDTGDTVAELDLGRTTRYANRAQRRALAARDRGCIFPACDRDHRHCDAHHVIWWEDGGPTDLDNLALLCRFHHTLVHAGLYRIDMADHRPVVRATDPDRPGGAGPAIDDRRYRSMLARDRRRPSR